MSMISRRKVWWPFCWDWTTTTPAEENEDGTAGNGIGNDHPSMNLAEGEEDTDSARPDCSANSASCSFDMAWQHLQSHSQDQQEEAFEQAVVDLFHSDYQPKQLPLCSPFDERISIAVTTTPITVPHYAQRSDWDCGLAACQMIFASMGVNAYDALRTELQGNDPTRQIGGLLEKSRLTPRFDSSLLQGTQSIWTQDLVYLLHTYQLALHLPFRYLFCSTCLAVNHTHKQLEYYQAAFTKDQQRLDHIAPFIQDVSIQLDSSVLTMDRILSLITKPNCVAIALIDQSILVRHSAGGGVGVTDPATPNTYLDNMVGPEITVTNNHPDHYVGHYIVLTGISRDPLHLQQISKINSNCPDFCLLIHNPAAIAGPSCLHPTIFEQAWTAPGTDRDVIFVVRNR